MLPPPGRDLASTRPLPRLPAHRAAAPRCAQSATAAMAGAPTLVLLLLGQLLATTATKAQVSQRRARCVGRGGRQPRAGARGSEVVVEWHSQGAAAPHPQGQGVPGNRLDP